MPPIKENLELTIKERNNIEDKEYEGFMDEDGKLVIKTKELKGTLSFIYIEPQFEFLNSNIRIYSAKMKGFEILNSKLVGNTIIPIVQKVKDKEGLEYRENFKDIVLNESIVIEISGGIKHSKVNVVLRVV